jgi:hypothetical protein
MVILGEHAGKQEQVTPEVISIVEAKRRCRMRYNVDVFWVTEAIGEEQINVALDVFSRNRAHEPQALLEVVR